MIMLNFPLIANLSTAQLHFLAGLAMGIVLVLAVLLIVVAVKDSL